MSICCNELPLDPSKMAYSASSGCIMLESFWGDYVIITKISDSKIKIEGTRWSLPAIFDLCDKHVYVYVGRNSVSFENKSNAYSRSINNILGFQLERIRELKKMLKSMKCIKKV